MHNLPQPWPWWPRILVISLLLAASTWAAKTIHLETELLALLPQDLPSVRGLDGFSRQFASDRELILIAPDDVPEIQLLQMFARLRPVLAALPGMESVQAPGEDWLQHVPQLTAWFAWNSPPERFGALVEALRQDRVESRLAHVPQELAGAFDWNTLPRLQFDPLELLAVLNPGQGPKFSLPYRDKAPRFIILRSAKPLIEFQDCAAFYEAVQSAIQATIPGEHRLLLTGRPAFTAEISAQMRHDMIVMVAAAVSLASLAFWAFYRSLKPLGWILLTQFMALGVALLGARLAVGSLNVISMGFGCILLGIGMDYSILVYHHFASPFRADTKIWRRLNRGIWFSAATTASAFLVLAFASLPGLRQLASLVAAGLLASAAFATWLLPAVWIPHPPRTLPFIQRASQAVAMVMDRHGRWLLCLILLTMTAAVSRVQLSPAVLYSADLGRFQPVDSQAYRGEALLEKHDPSATDAVFLVRAADWDVVRRAADELASHFPGHTEPTSTGLIPAPVWQVANRRLWPDGIADRLRADFVAAGLGPEWSKSTQSFADTLTRAAAGDAVAFAAIEPMLGKLLRQDDDGYSAIVRIPGMADRPIPATGLTFPGAEVLPVSWVALQTELNASSLGDLWRLGGIALLAIVVLCALAQRSLGLVLLNLSALVLALLLLAALLALSGIALSAFSLLCLPLLLGLVIDYSLHVLMTLEYERGDFHKLYAHIGAPILLTAIASGIGFGAPILTNQPALQNFGLVMDLGIVSAVFVCLFLLPVLARLTRTKMQSVP